MISLRRIVSSALLLAVLPTSHALDEILATHPYHPSYKTKFHNAISKEIDILSITTKNGHRRYEGVSYHVMPKTTVEAEVYEGEIIWAVLTDTDEVVSKFVIGAEKLEKYVVMWGTGDEL
ncbi:hypothetical protein ACHAWO_005262 [Cyclotella atomus]|jgi:hypothetical protein|uniref:Uncharacterized protein n=1 Tax=Cyclotella atomus TaxID=382360 RepID=A0ABD3NDC5_9STRA